MISRYKHIIILLIIILNTNYISYSQNLGSILEDELDNNRITWIQDTTKLNSLMKLHSRQSDDLYASRGITIDTSNYEEKTVTRLLEELVSYPNNIGILIYTYNEGSFISILLKKNGSMFTKKKSISRKEFIASVANYSTYYSSNGLNRGPTTLTTRNLEKTINETEEYIFPFKEEIKDLEHLIIVPALNLSNIPFAAIKLSENNYLIDLMSYSIAPSLLEVFLSKSLNESNGFISMDTEVSYTIDNGLFISNPTFNGSSKVVFNPLPGTEKEVKDITSLLKDSTYTLLNGKDAKFSNFYDNICNYDLLYFATHGISDNIDPLNNSYLALSMDDDGKSTLTAKDVQDIRLKCSLNADLVVLSACQTGIGKEHEAGVIGLARAFNIAGSNHVVMSLWNVDDEKTAILMSLFFNRLKEPDKLMPHSAFRKAILEFKNENNNPYYWSSFSILGLPY